MLYTICTGEPSKQEVVRESRDACSEQLQRTTTPPAPGGGGTEVAWPHFQQSIDLIMRFASQREVSSLWYWLGSSPPLAAGPLRPALVEPRPAGVCVPPSHPLVWRKFIALISTHRSYARGLLNINYISIFALTTRWLLICDLQTVTGNYWSGPCCHSDDN